MSKFSERIWTEVTTRTKAQTDAWNAMPKEQRAMLVPKELRLRIQERLFRLDWLEKETAALKRDINRLVKHLPEPSDSNRRKAAEEG